MKLGDLAINEEKLIDRNMAIIGATDSGKSYAAKKMLAATRLQTLVLDLEGEYPGKKVTPKNTWEARYLGEYIATHKKNVTVDYSKTKLPQVPGLTAALFDGLYAKRSGRANPILIFVDEAYFYAPEAGVPEAEAVDTEKCEAMLFTMQARGRHRGIGTVIVTQRPQYTRKHVLAQCQYWLVFRLNTPPELDWIRRQGYDPGVVEDIARLSQGECYAIGFNGPQKVRVPP